MRVALRVRRAQADDADQVAAIVVAGWRTAYRQIFDSVYFDSDAFAETRMDRWRTTLQDAPAEPAVFVAEEYGRTVGWISFGPPREGRDPAVGEVWGLYVSPDRWGLGVGIELLRRALTELSRSERRQVILWVLAENPRAIKFYSRSGFTLTGRSRERDFGPPGTAAEVEMRFDG